MKKRRTKTLLFTFFLTSFTISADMTNWPSISNDVPPPGEHPRVLFTRKDIPAIRQRAETPMGKAMIQEMKWQIHRPASDLLKKGLKEPKKLRGLNDRLCAYFSLCGMLYIVTGDEQYVKIGNQILDLYLERLGSAPATPASFFKRGTDELVLGYDCLYDKISTQKRELLKKHFESWLEPEANKKYYRKMGHLLGPVINGRPCDWGAIRSGAAAMTYCVIEGESDKIKSDALEPHLEMMRAIADYTIYPEGQMLSGNSYISGDFSDYFTALMALKRRGVNFYDHPHIKNISTWLMYEHIPGSWVYDNRNQTRGFIDLTPTTLCLANVYGGYANMLRDRATGPNKDAATWWAVGLIFGNFNETAPKRINLPLSFYSSSLGTTFSRSDWGEDAAKLTMTMEPPAGGHTHPDKGSFTFYANGEALAVDSGGAHFRADDHNTVLVDKKGQLGGQGRTDAIVETWLPSTLADITQMDVKPAYEQKIEYTNNTKERVVWNDLKWGKGLPFRWDKQNSFERNDRYAIFIRSESGAYAVIVDDIKKDDSPHDYSWILHSALPATEKGPREIQFKDRYRGEFAQSITGKERLTFNGDIPEKGVYNIWALTHTWPDLLQTHWHLAYRVGNIGGHRTYLRHHLCGWEWIQLKKTDQVDSWQLPKGIVPIYLSTRRGGRFAKIIAIKDLKLNPNLTAQYPKGDTVSFELDKNSLKDSWEMKTTPDAGMNVFFLAPAHEKLSFTIAPKPKQEYLTRLQAKQKSVPGNFTTVMVPFHETKSDLLFAFSKKASGQASIKHNNSVDYLFTLGKGDGDIQSDARFAMVRVENEEIIGYLMAKGTTLLWRGKTLVHCKKALSIVNDDKTCLMDAAEGTNVEFDRLGAREVVCNRLPISTSTRWFWKELELVEVPILPQKWKINVSKDGKTVFVTGNGRKPLKIHAPKAIKCVLNNLSVFFSRDGKGNIYPKTKIVTLTHGNDPVE